jgi:hypothetical protein
MISSPDGETPKRPRPKEPAVLAPQRFRTRAHRGKTGPADRLKHQGIRVHQRGLIDLSVDLTANLTRPATMR